MRNFLLSVFFLVTILASAQTYPLHPAVGDTIDRLEKLDYSLFPFIENDGFDFAYISMKDNTYLLNVIEENENHFLEPLTKEQIIESQQNIEKINNYYLRAAEEKEETTVTTTSKRQAYPIRIEGPMTEQMKKEARMHVRLKDDARRRREREQLFGTGTDGLHIEFR